jgi:hypothetical protein
MPGFNEPLWDQIAKALADINAQQAPVMPGSDEPPPDPMAKVLADLAHQVASLSARLDVMEARQRATTTTTTMPPVFPYGWPGYGMPAVSITGVQQIQDEGKKLQQIEQPTDIATEPAGKMLTCQVSAVVRLQAAARGLLGGCASAGAGDARSAAAAPPSCASPHGGP